MSPNDRASNPGRAENEHAEQQWARPLPRRHRGLTSNHSLLVLPDRRRTKVLTLSHVRDGDVVVDPEGPEEIGVRHKHYRCGSLRVLQGEYPLSEVNGGDGTEMCARSCCVARRGR
jgi:hypothetical protein